MVSFGPVPMGRHLLVAADGSSASREAFEFALDQSPDATLTIVHVINPMSSFSYADDDYFDLEGYQREEQRRRESAERLLGEYRDQAVDRGLAADTVLTVGRPAHRILEAADEHEVDQIVMGSRGRSGVGRVVFGSVAETVTRRATVPVTVVR